MTFDSQIDEFIALSRALNGQVISERPPWNTLASADAIRHFAYGISDDNPLWLDPDYAAKSPFGQRIAPPAFLASVLYPLLHGAPVQVPLSNLIGELEYRWFEPVREGDRLRAEARQVDVFETRDRSDRRVVYIQAETTYRNQDDRIAATALGTMARIAQVEKGLWLDRVTHQYSQAELDAIHHALKNEVRTGDRFLDPATVNPGDRLPPFVRGPLTVGDLVCWQAAIGPSYRAGSLGYWDSLAAPHTAVTIPKIGWPVKYSQEHEDFNLTKKRGMPAPFDNGVMRLSWLSVLLTNWMGDHGSLKRLRVFMNEPILYGDVTWYAATITGKQPEGSGSLIRLEIVGQNQSGATSTMAEAEVWLPTPPSQAAIFKPAAEIKPVSEPPPFNPVHNRLAAWAANTPEKSALRFGKENLNFADFGEKVQQLSDRLFSTGVRKGTIVAVCMERSAEAVLAIYAILQAGAAFLPLDPTTPAPRLEYMLSDSGAALLITDQNLLGELPESPVQAMDYETLISLPDPQEARPNIEVKPNSIAYILYTSGSTGHPKGAAVSHGALSIYLDALEEALPLSAAAVYLHAASFSFSASVRQLTLPISLGATLVVSSRTEQQDPRALLRLIQAQRVTVWDTVPTIWRHTLQVLLDLNSEQRGALLENKLAYLFTTGEPLDWDLPRRWKGVLGHPARVVNLYSQTETCGTVAQYMLPEEDLLLQGSVPLGQPLPHTPIYLLDEALQPVAPGQVGEVYVGGPRIARGYLHPDLEVEKFVRDPFTKHPDARMYRTGDRAKRRWDGTLEVRGRVDQMVKIRGFRVEPVEVERALMAHPDISEAVVAAQSSAHVPGDQLLVGYLVSSKDPAEISDLRGFLSRSLPEYMIPASFTKIEAIPRTQSGKTDRSALQQVEVELNRQHKEVALALATETESRLLEIWKTVLGRQKIGLEDGFFDLGGHSLLAVRLVTRIEAMFGVPLGLVDLFQNPTIRELAHFLQRDLSSKRGTPLVPLQPDGGGAPFFCVHGLTGDVLWYAELAGWMAPEHPFYGLEARGLDGSTQPLDRIPAIAEVYLEEILRCQPKGPYYVGGASFGGTVALEIAQQLFQRGKTVASLVIFDHIPLNQRRDPEFSLSPLRQLGRFSKNIPYWMRETARLALQSDHRPGAPENRFVGPGFGSEPSPSDPGSRPAQS